MKCSHIKHRGGTKHGGGMLAWAPPRALCRATSRTQARCRALAVLFSRAQRLWRVWARLCMDFFQKGYGDMSIDHAAYLAAAEALMLQIEQDCDRINASTDADIDNQREGTMLTLVFANRSQIVINLQKPLTQVWLAAQAGGFHYRWHPQGQPWRETRSGSHFFDDLSRCASEQAGLQLQFGLGD